MAVILLRCSCNCVAFSSNKQLKFVQTTHEDNVVNIHVLWCRLDTRSIFYKGHRYLETRPVP